MCAVFILSEEQKQVIVKIPDTKEHVSIKIENYGTVYITPKNLWEQLFEARGYTSFTVETKQS